MEYYNYLESLSKWDCFSSSLVKEVNKKWKSTTVQIVEYYMMEKIHAECVAIRFSTKYG